MSVKKGSWMPEKYEMSILKKFGLINFSIKYCKQQKHNYAAALFVELESMIVFDIAI